MPEDEGEVEDDHPPTRHGAAGGTPDPGDSHGEGSGAERREWWDETPTKRNKKPGEQEITNDQTYSKAIEDEIWFPSALRKAIG